MSTHQMFRKMQRHPYVHYLSIVALLPLVVSCNFQIDFDDDVQVADVEAQIRQTLSGYESAVNSMDWDEAAGFYADDPRLHWIESGNYQYESKAAIVDSLKGFGVNVSSVSMKMQDLRIVVLSYNSAIASFTFDQQMALAPGGGFEWSGAITVLMIKNNGHWQFLIGHSSTKMPRTN